MINQSINVPFSIENIPDSKCVSQKFLLQVEVTPEHTPRKTGNHRNLRLSEEIMKSDLSRDKHRNSDIELVDNDLDAIHSFQPEVIHKSCSQRSENRR